MDTFLSMYVIYKHSNSISGKCYIGKSKMGIERRWKGHVACAVGGHQSHFCNAIRKHSLESWSHEILEEVETNVEANLCEIKWIDYFNSDDPDHGYNMTKGGDRGSTCDPNVLSEKMRGRLKTEEHKQKIREGNKRYWAQAPETDARREKLINQNQSDVARKRSSETQKRRWANPEAHERMSKALKGKPKSEEHKRKLSEALKNRK